MWYGVDVALPGSVTTLSHGETQFHVVGTAHVSQRSVDEVRAVIEEVEPDLVCVELCQSRLDALTKDSAFRDLDVFKVVREGKGLYLLAHLALSSYQRRIGASLGVKPGAELLAAIETAKAKGIPIALIDRDITVTLKRVWRNLGLWKRMMLMWSLFVGWESDKGEPVTEATLDELKEPKALSEMLTELGRAVPEIKAPLVDERDQYLASKMLEEGAGKRKVVAVVGAAHVPGMTEQLGKPVDRAALDRVPPPSIVWRILKWTVPIAILGVIVWLWHRSDASTFAQTMLAWIIPTAIGAGAMALIAGGSLLSGLTAMLVSPVARIYPLVRTSIVVGLVEAWRRKPSVADCERLPEDVQSMRGFWKNPVTRILIVATAAGLGALAGFMFGVGWVASHL
ncbi:MAG: TraB family protein [Myxococcales bacterium]|nr:TraB family protein [Myxococcales bacterium]